MAKTCNCPNPPGGSITCSDDQLAICGYQDGHIVSGCFDPPSAIAAMPARSDRTTALSNWAMQQITGEIRTLSQRITSGDDKLLRSGTFINDAGERLTFVLPTKIRVNSKGGAAAASAGAD
jgi:hypothetical protein